jgi:hypothetical protein
MRKVNVLCLVTKMLERSLMEMEAVVVMRVTYI